QEPPYYWLPTLLDKLTGVPPAITPCREIYGKAHGGSRNRGHIVRPVGGSILRALLPFRHCRRRVEQGNARRSAGLAHGGRLPQQAPLQRRFTGPGRGQRHLASTAKERRTGGRSHHDRHLAKGLRSLSAVQGEVEAKAMSAGGQGIQRERELAAVPRVNVM